MILATGFEFCDKVASNRREARGIFWGGWRRLCLDGPVAKLEIKKKS